MDAATIVRHCNSLSVEQLQQKAIESASGLTRHSVPLIILMSEIRKRAPLTVFLAFKTQIRQIQEQRSNQPE